MSGQPDPKPTKRIKDSAAARRKLRSDVECRNPECSGRATDGHHILLRSQRGDDAEDNIMPLCHECHMRYHAGQLTALPIKQREWLYVSAKLGGTPAEEYLHSRYGVTGAEWESYR